MCVFIIIICMTLIKRVHAHALKREKGEGLVGDMNQEREHRESIARRDKVRTYPSILRIIIIAMYNCNSVAGLCGDLLTSF